jgi:small subunit ribosomal protein S20
MALRTKSGIKRHRQSLKRRARNTVVKSDLKTQLKKFEVALEGGDLKAAEQALRETESKLMKAASKGVLHKKTASRKAGRLASRLSGLSKPSEQTASS